MLRLEVRRPFGFYSSTYGSCCLLFIVLVGILIAMDDGSSSNKMSEELARRYKRSVKVLQPEKCKLLKAAVHTDKNILVRQKRDVSIDPIKAYEAKEEYARAKRRIESALDEYSKCRTNLNNKQCESIHQKILKMANDFSTKFSLMKDLIESFKLDMEKISEIDVALPRPDPLRAVLPRFHEDLNERYDFSAGKLRTVEHFVRNKQKPIDPNLGGSDTTRLSTKPAFRDVKSSNDKNMAPLSNANFGTNRKNYSTFIIIWLSRTI